MATDGAVKEDGRMGCAYVPLDDNAMPPRAFVLFCPPSAMRAELSGVDQAVADAPLDQDLTILTDSLASMQKLEALQRRTFQNGFTAMFKLTAEKSFLEFEVAI